MDLSQLPAPSLMPPTSDDTPTPSNDGVLWGGFKSGSYSAGADVYGALAAGQRLLGFDNAADASRANAANLTQAAAAERPDLDVQGFTGGGIGGAIKYLGYKGAQFVPQFLGMAGAGALAGALAPEAAVGAAGVAGAEALAPAAEALAPAAEGLLSKLGIKSLGAAAGAYPFAAGGLSNAAAQHGDDTKAGSLAALAGGVPLAVVQSMGFGAEKAATYAGAAFAHAAAFGLGQGAQTGAEDAFDPSLTVGDRASRIVSSAVSGALLGGIFGAGMHLISPHATDAQVEQNVDQQLQSPSVGGGIDSLNPNQQPASVLPPEMRTPYQGSENTFTNTYPATDRLMGVLNRETPPEQPPIDQTPDAAIDRMFNVATRETPPEQAPQPFPAIPEQSSGVPPLVDRTPDALIDRMFQATTRQTPPEQAPDPAMAAAYAQHLDTLNQQPETQTPVAPTEAQAAQISPEDNAALHKALGLSVDETPPAAKIAEQADATQAQKQAVLQQFGDRDGAIAKTGAMRDFLDNADISNEHDLYNALEDQLNDKTKVSKSAGFKVMAQQIGLLDEDNKPLDLDKARAEAADIPNPQAQASEMAFLDSVAQRRQVAGDLRTPTSEQQAAAAPTDDPVEAARNQTLDELMSEQYGAPQGDMPPKPFGVEDPADVIARDRRRIQQMYDGPDRRVATTEPQADAPAGDVATTAPLPIADRVTDAAHDLTGGMGGEAKIADIRAKLPDVASDDIDNALRQIHGDDSDSTLTQAPKGQRAGVDGVSVQGQGRFHNLSVEPREQPSAVQERSTEAVDQGQQARSVPADGAGDDRSSDPAAQSEQGSGEGAREAGAPGEPGDRVARISNQTVEGQRANQAAAIADLHNRTVKAMRTVDENGATTLPVEAIGTEPEDVTASLMEQPERFLAPDDGNSIQPKQQTLPERRADVLPPDQVQQHFEDATASLRPNIKDRVHLVNSEAELPQALRDQAVRQNLDLDHIPGQYYKREVYIRGDQITSPEMMQEMVSHEVTHLANEEQTGGGSAHDQMMKKIWDRIGGAKKFEELARKYNSWDENKQTGAAGLKEYLDHGFTEAQLVDELFAHAQADTTFGPARRATLAMLGRVKQAIADLLDEAGLTDFAAKFRTFGVEDVEKWLEDDRRLTQGEPDPDKINLNNLPGSRMNMALRRQDDIHPSIRTQLDNTEDTMRKVGAVAQEFARTPFTKIVEGLEKYRFSDPELYKHMIRTVVNSLKTTQDMIRTWGKKIPEMAKDYHANEMSRMVSYRLGQALTKGQRQLAILKRNARPIYDKYVDMMQSASQQKLDPTHDWKELTWLHDRPDADQLRAEHTRLRNIWNSLGQPGKNGRPSGAQDMYHEQQTGSKGIQYAQHIARLHFVVDGHGVKVDGFESHAIKDIPNRTDVRDATGMHNFMKEELDKRVKGLSDYLATADKNDPRTVDLRSELTSVQDSMQDMERAPYTHLGRTGDYFSSFVMKAGDDLRNASQETVQAIQALAKKYGMADLRFTTLGGNRQVFIRSTNASQLRNFTNELRGMTQHLDENTEPRFGSVLSAQDWHDGNIAPQIKNVMEQVSNKLKDNPEAQTATMNALRGAYLDAMPDASGAKLQAHRAGVQGYSGDMLKNYSFSSNVATNAIGRLAYAQERADHTAKLIRRSQDLTKQTGKDVLAQQDAIKASIARNAAENTRVDASLWGKLRGAAHSYYLACSPAYAVMQIAQTYTLTLPELIKHHGVANSVAAMASSFNDIRHVLGGMADIKRQQFAATLRGEATDITGGITPQVLAAAVKRGLSPEMAKFLTTMDNMGKLEFGTFSQDNIKGLENGAISNVPMKVLQYANSTATMSELSARLVAAISAKKLYDKAGDETKARLDAIHGNGDNYAGHVVSESMYDWGGSATSKGFSNAGILGPASPVVFQFHGFSTRLFNKLTSESYNAIKGETPEDAAEARRFMMAHLAAILTLSGTLGLPLAGWAAGAATRASTLIPGGPDEPYDVQAHFRAWLANTFGKTAGDIAARGAIPSLLNTDFSDLGDKNLLPLTDLLQDRRKLEDSVPDYLSRAWGSSLNIGLNGLIGSREIMNGRPLEGLARMLPTSMKNIAKAYQISERGYVDSRGQPIPGVTAGATDVIKQALGMKSEELGTARDRNTAFEGMKQDRQYHAGVIKQNIAVAMEQGDQVKAQHWMQEAVKYDQDPSHRGSPLITPDIPNYLAMRRRAAAYSGATGLPIGLNPRDLPATNLVNF